MSHRSRVCPACGALNSRDEVRCHRCQRRLPGAVDGALASLLDATVGRVWPATHALVGSFVVLFALVVLSGDRPGIFGTTSFAHHARFGAFTGILDGASVVAEWWRVASAGFVHLGVLHIAFNGFATIDYGRRAEEEFGSARLLVLFIVTSSVGFVASWIWYAGWYSMELGFGLADFRWELAAPTAGASAGVCGLIGSRVGQLAALRAKAWKPELTRAILYLVILALLPAPINNAAHFGGFAAGLAVGYLFGRDHRPWRREAHYRVAAALLVGGVVAAIVGATRSPVWERIRAAELATERAMGPS